MPLFFKSKFFIYLSIVLPIVLPIQLPIGLPIQLPIVFDMAIALFHKQFKNKWKSIEKVNLENRIF